MSISCPTSNVSASIGGVVLGAENVKSLKGHIEEIPLPENTVDVIISNRVTNLTADKGRVIREGFGC